MLGRELKVRARAQLDAADRILDTLTRFESGDKVGEGDYDDDETAARSARGEEGVAEGIAPGGGRARPVWVSVLHDDARRVMATIGDEHERNHTPVGVVRNDVARARFIRGIGTVRSRESAGWVATGHGRRE